jgi:hypothetical protein
MYDRIGNRLLGHHLKTPHKLNKRQFEYVFVGASKKEGWDASITEDSTNPGEDVKVNGTSYSLKTEAAKGIKEDRITISKLMEARWIREADTADDFLSGVNKYIVPHLKRYERILMLRAFSLDRNDVEQALSKQDLFDTDNRSGKLDADDFLERTEETDRYIRYDLVEIPRSHLLKLEQLSPSDFDTDYDSGSARVSVESGGQRLFEVFFDGSVEKITVRNLLVSECHEHASWTVQGQA